MDAKYEKNYEIEELLPEELEVEKVTYANQFSTPVL